jgi:Ca2+-binding EF-hand superfamily protein
MQSAARILLPDQLLSQLPNEKFQKSHKKFRMFDKNNDHHIGKLRLLVLL